MTRSVRLSLVLATLLSAGPAAAASFPDLVRAVSTAAPAGEGVDAASKALRVGHFSLVFASGRLYPLVGDGIVVGAYFTGSGRVVYTSNDKLEAPSYRANVSRVSAYKIDPDGSISDDVTRAAIYFSAAPPGLGLPSGPFPPQGEATLASWKEHVARFEKDRNVRAVQIVPQALIEAPKEPVLVMEIEAKKDDLAYLYDQLRSGEESIATLRKLDIPNPPSFLRGLRFPNDLSTQPIGRDRLTALPPRAVLTAVDVTLTNPSGIHADLQVKETYSFAAPARTLALSLWSHLAGAAGSSFSGFHDNPYELLGVRTAGGADLMFSHVEGDLVVELPAPVAAGEKVSLVFDIAGDVLFPPSNDNYWELGTSEWFPQPGRLLEQAFTYHAVIKVRKPYTAFSDGATVRRWEEGDLACAEFSEERPISIPVVIAGRYTTKSEERAGVTVRVSSYAMAKAIAEKKITNILFDLLDFYSHYLGPFPFKEINVIEINKYGFGQAPAGVIRITKEAFNPYEDDVAKIFSRGINQRLAHELAHTWWGHVAKLGRPENTWMSESLAEYFSWYALSNVWEKGKMDEGIAQWKRIDGLVDPKGTVFMAAGLSGREGQREYVALAYSHGPLVLHAFRKEVGDNAFFTICKSYLKNFAWKPAETKEFIGLANFVTKKDWGPWFDAHLMGTVPPEKQGKLDTLGKPEARPPSVAPPSRKETGVA
jgi:hypothetical protein